MMSDPYAPPQAQLDDTPEALVRSPARVRAWGISTTIVLAMVAGIAYSATAAFEQVFNSFGADLPWLTMLFLKGRLVWFALPALALVSTVAAWRYKPLTEANQRLALLRFYWLIGVTVVLVTVAVPAMYNPIFRIGQPV